MKVEILVGDNWFTTEEMIDVARVRITTEHGVAINGRRGILEISDERESGETL